MIRATISKADMKKMADHLVKNVHWGTVVALTRTVGDTRKDALTDIHRVFQIRSHWVPGSFKKTEATKGNLNATVGTIQRFLFEHEKSGQRHSVKPNKSEGIPEYARRSSSMTTRSSKWPGALLKRNPSEGKYGARFARFPPQGPFYRRHKRGAKKNKFYGSKARGGDRYFFLNVQGRTGPIRLLVQRMSRTGKGKKNRVWYVVAPGGKVHLEANHFWRAQIPSILKHFDRHIGVELSKALNHGRP